MKEITARLWENKMSGTTYGKGLYRKAIYNGTLELNDPYAKYLVDFEEIADWFHFAKSPLHQQMAQNIDSIPENESGVFMTWLYRYEQGIKTPIGGYAALDLNNNRILIQVDDQGLEISEHWELPVRNCISKTPGKPTPALIATTLSELNSPQKPATNGGFIGRNKQLLEGLLNSV